MSQGKVKPIWEPGRRAKVMIVALVSAVVGSGGGFSAESVMTAVSNLISKPSAPTYGQVTAKVMPVMLVLEREDGSNINVIVDQEDFAQFQIGSYYVARPGALTVEGDVIMTEHQAPIIEPEEKKKDV